MKITEENVTIIIDDIIVMNGNHQCKPDSLSESDFLRRAVAVKALLAGEGLNGVIKAGYPLTYARNITNMYATSGAINTLTQRRGTPRRVSINLSENDISHLQYVFNINNGEQSNRAGALLDYAAGGRVYPLCEKYGITKTVLYRMINLAALGEIDESIKVKGESFVLELTADEKANIRSHLKNHYRRKRAAWVLAKENHSIARLDVDDYDALRDSPVAYVEWISPRDRQRVDQAFVEFYNSLDEQTKDAIQYLSGVKFGYKWRPARVIMLYLEGVSDSRIAETLGTSRQYVGALRKKMLKSPKEFIDDIYSRVPSPS